ncbi:TolC family protein [Dokdonella sp.]|jgi:cobalt-zinc-cadmium efflux system outer membrane protein|uniref:TolC family protein n=1 Tax=Dokdonella sp. TaxID=2291710 RepID=UPI002DD63703|nr:TolC family protein [Dokdonella sp.]
MRHLLPIVLLTLHCAAWAQTATLTEAEAIRRGLARPELSDLDTAQVDIARSDVVAAGALPNPTIGYTSDRGRSSNLNNEETWLLSQSFDLSGRRGLRREAAELRVESAYSGNRLRHVEWAAEIRQRFHETLFKQEVVRATESWAQRFKRVEGIIEKLAKAGEASGYDRRRLARERQNAELRLNSAKSDLDRASQRLAALVGAPGNAPDTVVGELLPVLPQAMAEAVRDIERRPDLQVLSRRAEAADLEGKAAARGWIPDVTLGVGPKRRETSIGNENSTVMTISLPLPVFDRQQAGQQRAAAEAMHARGEFNLARARAEGELHGLYRQLERLISAAKDYRGSALAETPELLRIAEAAYKGGESSLLELLDAYRGAQDTEINALELDWKARQARIEYDLLTGSTTQ